MLVCLAANAQTNNYSMVTSTSELYEGAKVILVGFNESADAAFIMSCQKSRQTATKPKSKKVSKLLPNVSAPRKATSSTLLSRLQASVPHSARFPTLAKKLSAVTKQ